MSKCENCGLEAENLHRYELGCWKHPDGRWEPIVLMECEACYIANPDVTPTLVADKVPGRNDPCLCGSGKKFKKCCSG